MRLLCGPGSITNGLCPSYPPGITDKWVDEHTLGWVERINHSAAAYLTPSQLIWCVFPSGLSPQPWRLLKFYGTGKDPQ